jgi:hypothetical protein
MDSHTSDLQSLASRVERLEGQNRFLKRAGLALLLLPVALIIMGQARPPRTIEAEDFILKDATGIRRAELKTMGGPAGLFFFDSKGDSSSLVGDGFVLLVDSERTKAATSAGSGYVLLNMSNGDPNILLRDYEGFSASLGVTDTVTIGTGQKHTTSAASLTLLGAGKDGKVIWTAP